MGGAVPPLEGILVVSLEQAVAAPFCSSRLADAGARVIKVERPEGDFARGYDDVANGQSSYFVWLNRGKESIVLDLRSEDDSSLLLDLLGQADIFIQNLKPGALDRLGIGVEVLRKRFHRLITCSISGYGMKGPLADRKAYDMLIQAESGLSSITGGPNEPARVGISMVDIAAGATAHAAIVEALFARERSGYAAHIDVSMFDVMADWLTVPLLHQEGGKPPHRIGLSHPSIAPYGVFATKDEAQLLIAIQNDREWRTFADHFLSKPELATDPRFSTNVQRVNNRTELDRTIALNFASLSKDTVEDKLQALDIAFAAVNDMAKLSSHPQLRRVNVATPKGPITYPAPAAIFDGIDRALGPVPSLGQQTAEIVGARAKRIEE